MTNIDFIMAIVIIIGVVSFTVYYVSGDFSSSLNQMSVLELKQSASILENRLFNDLFREDIKVMKASFTDISNAAHEENIVIMFSGVGDVKMYDKDFNLISSGTNELRFPLAISADQIKYFNIIYNGTGTVSDISGDINITSRILSEQVYPVVSEEKCANANITFEHNFKIKIGSCEKGIEPPAGTVIADKVPILLSTGKDFATVMVW